MTSGKMISNHSLSVFWLNSLILESPNQPSPAFAREFDHACLFQFIVHVHVQCIYTCECTMYMCITLRKYSVGKGGKFGGSTWREIWRKYMYVRLQGVFIIIVPAIKGGISIVFWQAYIRGGCAWSLITHVRHRNCTTPTQPTSTRWVSISPQAVYKFIR